MFPLNIVAGNKVNWIPGIGRTMVPTKTKFSMNMKFVEVSSMSIAIH